ncbi:MAG TPA: XkdF-like putative serine protease domain-containing protein [Stellaceae bacterium]|nr:XkdF-like putative serine protease domain-containing protein [Stellaceae bacterium]
MKARLFNEIRKDAPTVGDVHATTAVGNSTRRRRYRLFSAITGGSNEPTEVTQKLATETKEHAGYVEHPVGGHQCSACSMFRAPGRCTLVMGLIRPDGHCRHWQAKTAKAADRALKPFEDGMAHTPFPYDANALGSLRHDQIPRFLGAVTNPGAHPTRHVDLKSLHAIQNRVDPEKVERMRRGAMRGKTKPMVIRWNDRDYIADGHHRLAADYVDGHDAAEVHYLDLTPMNNAVKRDAGWRLPFEVRKAEPEQQLIFGWASVVTKNGELVVDKQQDVIEPAELEKAAYEFVLYSRAQGDMHEKVGVGRMIESMVFTKEKQDALGIVVKDEAGRQIEGWWIGFKVDDPGVWAAHKQGERPEFSIGGMAVSQEA